MQDYIDKLLGMLKSRRFLMAVLAILTIVLQDGIGLEPEQANWIATIIITWIAGDSWKKTDRLSTKAE